MNKELDVSKIKRAQRHQGRTSNWMAKRIGVTNVTFSNWLKSGRIPYRYGEVIGDILGIPLKDLCA